MKFTQMHGYHASHAKMVEFAGYDMPLWYTSTSDEHLAVRERAGTFDVSHMGRVAVSGPDSTRFLERLVPTSVGALEAWKSVYTVMLNERAGIIDDLIIMRKEGDDYVVVVNAVNHEKDVANMLGHLGGLSATLTDMTPTSAMFAVQGPLARGIVQALSPERLGELGRFRSCPATVAGRRCIVSRTGYTGEDGFELIVEDTTVDDPAAATAVWDAVAGAAKPCGLGARDSLRVEAGYPLWGSDIDEETNPFAAGLTWVVSPEKSGYTGAEALSRAKGARPSKVRKGVVLDQGIPRHGFEVVDSAGLEAGEVTSGSYSPILKRGIALCYLKQEDSSSGTRVGVRVRDAVSGATVVRPPFYDEKVYGWKRQDNSK